jgi:Winged helix DNA-binding domain
LADGADDGDSQVDHEGAGREVPQRVQEVGDSGRGVRGHGVSPGLCPSGSAAGADAPGGQGAGPATPGNLITHLRKLEDAGYISSEKTGRGVASQTSVTLTNCGRSALDAYTHALRDLLSGL